MSSQCSVLNKKVALGETKKIPENQKNDGEKKKATEDVRAKNEDYGVTEDKFPQKEKYPHSWAILKQMEKRKQQAAGGNNRLREERANLVFAALVDEPTTWKRYEKKTPEDYMEEHRASQDDDPRKLLTCTMKDTEGRFFESWERQPGQDKKKPRKTPEDYMKEHRACEAERIVPTALQRTNPFHFSIHPSTYRNHPPSHSSCSSKLICWSKEGDWGHASDADWMNGDVRGTSAMFRCGIRFKKLQRDEKVQNLRGAARPNGK